MNRFLMFTLLVLTFAVGFGSIAVTIWPQISTRSETAALIKEVP